jgi:hypothetical protein
MNSSVSLLHFFLIDLLAHSSYVPVKLQYSGNTDITHSKNRLNFNRIVIKLVYGNIPKEDTI